MQQVQLYEIANFVGKKYALNMGTFIWFNIKCLFLCLVYAFSTCLLQKCGGGFEILNRKKLGSGI